jgi:hypothetical protein
MCSDEYSSENLATQLCPYTFYTYSPFNTVSTLITTFSVPVTPWTISMQTIPAFTLPIISSTPILTGTFGIPSASSDGSYQLLPSTNGVYYVYANTIWTKYQTSFPTFIASAMSSSGKFQWLVSSIGIYCSNTYGKSFRLIQSGNFSWVSVSPNGQYVYAGYVPSSEPSSISNSISFSSYIIVSFQ